MIIIRSFLFHALFYIGTFLLLLLFLPCLILYRPLFIPRVFTGYARWLLTYVVGLHVDIEGKEHIPNEPFLIVSNHQSAWETLMLFTLFKHPVVLLKKELTYIPFFGWFLLKTGMIPVHRKSAATSFKTMLKAIHQRLYQEGRPVCIFPEGTRKKPGEPMHIKKGVYAIYHHVNAPILCMVHNAGMYWPPHQFVIQPGTVNVFIYPPLPCNLKDEALKKILPIMLETKAMELATKGISL